MTDYIKREDAVKVLGHDCIRYVFPTTAEPTTEFIKLNNAINLLQLYPSEDVEPVVRCKNCKRRRNAKKNGRVYWDGYEYYCEIAHYGVTDDGFCFYGERKDNE